MLKFKECSYLKKILQNNHEHLFLQGEDKLYLNISDSQLTSGQRPLVDGWDSAHGPGVLLGNKFWQIIPLPQNYLQTNWPIRVGSQSHWFIIGICHWAFIGIWLIFDSIINKIFINSVWRFDRISLDRRYWNITLINDKLPRKRMC